MFSQLYTHTTVSVYPHRLTHTWWFFAILIKVEGCQSQIDNKLVLHMILWKECVWASRLWGDVDDFHGFVGEPAHVRGGPYHHLIHHGRKLVGFRWEQDRVSTQFLYICTYPLKEHIYVTTSIEQHIHALLFAFLCFNEYWTTYKCVYTLKDI